MFKMVNVAGADAAQRVVAALSLWESFREDDPSTEDDIRECLEEVNVEPTDELVSAIMEALEANRTERAKAKAETEEEQGEG